MSRYVVRLDNRDSPASLERGKLHPMELFAEIAFPTDITGRLAA